MMLSMIIMFGKWLIWKNNIYRLTILAGVVGFELKKNKDCSWVIQLNKIINIWLNLKKGVGMKTSQEFFYIKKIDYFFELFSSIWAWCYNIRWFWLCCEIKVKSFYCKFYFCIIFNCLVHVFKKGCWKVKEYIKTTY